MNIRNELLLRRAAGKITNDTIYSKFLGLVNNRLASMEYTTLFYYLILLLRHIDDTTLIRRFDEFRHEIQDKPEFEELYIKLNLATFEFITNQHYISYKLIYAPFMKASLQINALNRKVEKLIFAPELNQAA